MLKPSSLCSSSLPPLTCAGCVLQASPLPEGRQGLVFGPCAPGCVPGGQVGGHVPGSRWLKLGKEELSESELRLTERR